MSKTYDSYDVLANVASVICQSMNSLCLTSARVARGAGCGETSVANAKQGLVFDHRVLDAIARTLMTEHYVQQGESAAQRFMCSYLQAYGKDLFEHDLTVTPAPSPR